MKRYTVTVLAICAALTSSLLAQPSKKEKAAAPASGATKASTPANQASANKATRLVKVATLNTVEANREFQANVQLLQAQRQAAVEIAGSVEKEKDTKRKAELQTQLDQLMKKLNENNEQMAKTYGFSLTRNYTMEIESAHVYMQVTDEEATKIEKAQKDAAAKAPPAKK